MKVHSPGGDLINLYCLHFSLMNTHVGGLHTDEYVYINKTCRPVFSIRRKYSHVLKTRAIFLLTEVLMSP